MYIKIHDSYRRIIAICDNDLIGKKFEEGKRQLDVRESFYSGEEVDEERVVEMMKGFAADDATFSIVGSKSVEMALDAGVISDGNVGKVDGVPFALVLL